ncbi:MAG: HD domain-containing protein [Bacteroidota bacterium]|nr:HD domain-containing protein [Bacteroidota bacterium]
MKNPLHKSLLLFLLLAFGLSVPVNLVAQKQFQIDSLNKLLNGAVDTQKVRLHIRISFLYNRVNADSAFKHAEKALELSGQTTDSLLIARSMLQLGIVQVNVSKFADGLANALKAFHIFEKEKIYNSCAYAANIIGNGYVGSGYPEQALQWYKKSLVYGEKDNNEFKIAVALFGIGNIEYELKMFDSAATHYKRCEVLFQKLGKNREAVAAMMTRAKIIFDKGLYYESLQLLLSSQKDIEELNDYYLLGYFYQQTGACYRELKKHGQALENQHTALGHFRKIKGESNIRDVYQDIAKTHFAIGNIDSAYQYLSMYVTLNDSLFTLEKSEKIAEMQARFESVEKDKQLLRNDIVIQQQANQQILLGIGLGIMLVLAIIAGLSYRRKRRDNLIIATEKRKSDELLLNILPVETAEELKQYGSAKARSFDMVTVMFTDFKDFTAMSEKLTAVQLVTEINECFVAFDHIIGKYGIEKIKTIGDAYMAAGGLPTPTKTHALDVVNAALEIQEFIREQKKKKGDSGFDIRIGIHSGPVVAGIVGIKKFAYDIWGDTVNTASRMESSGVAGKINISATTYELVKDHFRCVPRGKVNAKGKGQIDMYFLGESSGSSADFTAASVYILARLANELSTDYYYHNIAHTLDVVAATERLAVSEGITDPETLLLLKTAALYHDTGFLEVYPDNELNGARIAAETLPEFGYSQEQIEIISRLILATVLKAVPSTLEESIVKDADLDYLGRNDYKLLSLRLKQEWEHQGMHKTMPEWYELQINFLSSHHYYTISAQDQREEMKQKQLEEIKNTADMWSSF